MRMYNSYLKSIKKSEAYWISPKGKILPMGDSNHITEIINNPEVFDYTLQQLKDIYKHHNEEFGIEGNAREQIIKDLINKKWIRIRKYTRPDRWTVNIKVLDNKTKDYIKYWSEEMSKIGYGQYSDVYIDSLSFHKKFSLQDLKNDIL